MWRRGGVEIMHSARDNASTAGAVRALAVPSTLCHLLHRGNSCLQGNTLCTPGVSYSSLEGSWINPGLDKMS